MIAVYPGSFDPVTLGHLDIVERGARLARRLVVAVAVNVDKKPLFPVEERVRMLEEATRGIPNVEVTHFEGMAVDFVRRRGATVLLRGIRTVSDFETEFQMALTNRVLAPTIETVFVMASLPTSFLSSRLIKETASLGGDVTPFVPAHVARRLAQKFGHAKTASP